jgi:hypothetical protein
MCLRFFSLFFQKKIEQLRKEIEKDAAYKKHPEIRRYVNDTTLHRYLRARGGNLDKAKALLLGTIQWRTVFFSLSLFSVGSCVSASLLLR